MYLEIIKGAYYAYKIINAANNNLHDKYADYLERASNFINDFYSSEQTDRVCIERSVSILESIPTNVKDHIKAAQNFLLAICYYHLNLKKASIRCLDIVRSIEINPFTVCSDAIKSYQESEPRLREMISAEIPEYAFADNKTVLTAKTRLMIDDKFLIKGRGCVFTGVVEKGHFNVGDIIVIITPSAKTYSSAIDSIELNSALVATVKPGDNVGLFFKDISLFDKIPINSCCIYEYLGLNI